MDALAQIVERAQVVAPVGVKALQQHRALKLGEVFAADQFDLGVKNGVGALHHFLQNLVVGDRLRAFDQGTQRQRHLPVVLQRFF